MNDKAMGLTMTIATFAIVTGATFIFLSQAYPETSFFPRLTVAILFCGMWTKIMVLPQTEAKD